MTKPLFLRIFGIAAALIFFHSCVKDIRDLQHSANKAIREKTYTQFRTSNRSHEYIRAYNKALALFDVPYEEEDVPTTFGTAHVIMAGPKGGRPLVLLHGMNASSTQWYPNVKALSAEYRVYMIDFLLEPGKSISKRKVMTMEEIDHWYDEIFAHYELKDINLVGESRGGWLAIDVALNSADKIRRLILLSPAQSFTSIQPKGRILYNIFYATFPRRSALRTELKTMTSNVDKIRQPYIDQYYIAVKHQKLNLSLPHMTTYPDDELKSLHMPVLLLVGDNDAINDEGTIKRAKDLVPHVHAEMVKGASHFISIDQADYVNKSILNFIK